MTRIRQVPGRAMFVAFAALAIAACSGGDDNKKRGPGEPGPGGLSPEGISVELDPSAPEPDANDAPPVDGLRPETLPGDTALYDYGLVPIVGGESPNILMTLPDDAYSVTVLLYGHEGTSVMLTYAEAPDGSLLIDDQEPANPSPAGAAFPAQFDSPNRAIPSVTTGAFLLPNTPDVTSPSGVYRLKVGGYTVSAGQTSFTKNPVDRPLHLMLLVRRAATRPTTGTLNLTLHFTGANDLTASNAPNDTQLNQALEVMRAAYGSVGVNLGDIEYVDLDEPSLRTVVLGEEGCQGGDLDTLLRHSADVSFNNVNLFFIERFQCMTPFGDLGQAIGGITGGIPGTPLIRGGTHTGVAVSTAMFFSDPTTVAVVMAHETGHFLGLYHTQENNLFGFGPPTFDNISDTPNTDNGAQSNLMYFSAGTATALSEGQGYVMHNNPWVIH